MEVGNSGAQESGHIAFFAASLRTSTIMSRTPDATDLLTFDRALPKAQ